MSWGRMRPTGRWSWQKPVPPPTPTPTPTPVVVIDEDDDDADDSEVIIIDDATGIARAAAACNSKKGNSSGSNVINLDDDEDEGAGGGGRGGADRAGPSTAGAARSPATPVRASARNRYGLGYVSDSDQSDLSEGSDSDSDCEILPSGAARKVWEKAASRRTMPPHDAPKRNAGRASTSASSAESSTHHGENFENPFASECPLDDHIAAYFGYAFNPAGPSSTNGAEHGAGPSSECPLDDNVSEYFGYAFNPAGPSRTNGAEHGAGPSSACNVQECPMDHDSAGNEEATHSHKAPVPEKAPETSHPPHPDETLNPEGYTSYSYFSKNRVFPSCSADWKDNNRIFVSTSEKMDGKISEGSSLKKDSLQQKKMCFAPDDDSLMDQLTEDPVSTSRHGCFRQSGEYVNMTAPKNDTLETCSLSQKDFVDDPEKLGLSAVVQDGPHFKDGLIGAREKHKESDEYKRATEEEWASRQRQLAIQAEEAKEAKRLRKRKKAEALRLLDMQKRQKQRLEEVRETQRKGEEDIQLKEQCRGAVRLELENMERTCTDVSSILRALGIPVQGGEVKAAYKRALLKFHPDRVSRTDIYQQVKAEETFKFISRFKEKMKL